MDISLKSFKLSLSRFFGRYHFVLFIVFAVGSLSIAIFMLSQVVTVSDQQNGYTSSVNSTTFDQQTINQLRSLSSSSETTDKLETSGRTNPFVE